MIIAFVHDNKAFLPEVNAYTRFFSRYNIPCEVVNKDELGLLHRHVEWFFMGIDLSKPKEGIYKIHEYISPSVPPFSYLKDLCKSIINSQPDFRIFKNELVRARFNFKDHIPHFFREIGINSNWLEPAADHSIKKEYDFIYIGDLSEKRKPESFINCFTKGDLQQRSLLLLGKEYETLQKKYQHCSNIIFKGPVAHDEVATYIQKAKFGINYIPDINPFNQIASTKLLEYAACKIPVISTDYAWVRAFQQQYGGEFFYLAPDYSNFNWEAISRFNYSFPDVSSWTWERQIRSSGIPELLQTLFPELNFKNNF